MNIQDCNGLISDFEIILREKIGVDSSDFLSEVDKYRGGIKAKIRHTLMISKISKEHDIRTRQHGIFKAFETQIQNLMQEQGEKHQVCKDIADILGGTVEGEERINYIDKLILRIKQEAGL